jgi:Na+/H+-dicarboxylate symporter
MSRHKTTRRTIRLYAIFTSVAASLGIGIALGADPWPGQDPASAAAPAVAVASPQVNAVDAGNGYDEPDIRTGQS